jgi:hypothetical protein
MLRATIFCVLYITVCLLAPVFPQEPTKKTWKYAPELLRPFWQGDRVEGGIRVVHQGREHW